MFSERVMNGKTRITVEIDDCNLLRLRVLLLCDDVKGSGENLFLSEYLNEFLTRAIPDYAQDMSERIGDTFNPKLRLLEELADLKIDWFDREMNMYCDLPKEVYLNECQETEEEESSCESNGKWITGLMDSCRKQMENSESD